MRSSAYKASRESVADPTARHVWRLFASRAERGICGQNLLKGLASNEAEPCVRRDRMETSLGGSSPLRRRLPGRNRPPAPQMGLRAALPSGYTRDAALVLRRGGIDIVFSVPGDCLIMSGWADTLPRLMVKVRLTKRSYPSTGIHIVQVGIMVSSKSARTDSRELSTDTLSTHVENSSFRTRQDANWGWQREIIH